jgi:hypothetical protein
MWLGRLAAEPWSIAKLRRESGTLGAKEDRETCDTVLTNDARGPGRIQGVECGISNAG